MSTQSKPDANNKVPRGVIIIAVLLWAGALIPARISLAPTATLEQFDLPRSLLWVGALALVVLGYGLIRLRRWAWIATILIAFVNGYFLLLLALDQGTEQFAGLLVLIALVAYLVQPRIRERFLGNSARR